jgi:SAM-dependent methyltransferase
MTDRAHPPVEQKPLGSYLAWAADRNKQPILEVFRALLPTSGRALEIGSGAGIHVNHMAPHFPGIAFQPSDYDVEVFPTISARARALGNANVADPILLDLTDPATFPDPATDRFDVIFAINLFHAAPRSVAEGLAKLAESLLGRDGRVVIYGPFKIDGTYTAESNRRFDEEIRAAGVAEWGLRDIRDLEEVAGPHGLSLISRIDLPSNNFVFVFAPRRGHDDGR